MIGDAKVEEAIVNAEQHKVGESNWVADVGVDEDERSCVRLATSILEAPVEESDDCFVGVGSAPVAKASPSETWCAALNEPDMDGAQASAGRHLEPACFASRTAAVRSLGRVVRPGIGRRSGRRVRGAYSRRSS